MTSPDLSRFVAAQDQVWDNVTAELRAGAKASHWMWFVFPQISGLGRSAMAERFALTSLEEARAYLAHPVLGLRLREAVGLLLPHRGTPPERILGSIDAMKLRSCLTLFSAAVPNDPLFAEALEAFYGREPDARTLSLLSR